MTPRDSTVMGLEGVLLGAHAEGVRNILAVTGDPPHVGDYPGSRGVYEVDSIGLVQLLSALNRGEDYVGKGIDAPTSFFVGVAVNPSADDLELELERFRRKIDAGARFAMTQALFDVDLLDRFAERLGGAWPVPVLAGVWPLRSHAMALRLHNDVPGISVPGTVLDALQDAGADAPAVGLELARGLVEGARSAPRGSPPSPRSSSRSRRSTCSTDAASTSWKPPRGCSTLRARVGGRYRWIDPMTLRHPRPKRGWPGDGRARRRPSAGRSARVRLRAPHARVRRRNEGGHHERRRLPACALRARRNVPVLEGRRTSAGAIAAAAAAAAEHGRERRGFEKLAALPAWIGDGDNLLGLFQPHVGTRRYFRLLTAGVGRTGMSKGMHVAGAALVGFPLTAIAGVAPGVALLVLALWAGQGALAVCAVVAGSLLALLGLALALGGRIAFGRHARSAATGSASAPVLRRTAGHPA